jgi:hypothetical protein
MKILRTAVVLLALPASLAAQQPPAAPTPAPQAPAAAPANPVTTAFRGRILALHRNLGQAFDSIPAGLFSYKPTPAQQTIGYIVQHLANDNYLFCNAFGTMKGTRSAAATTTADSIKAVWPKDTLVAQVKESFAFCQRALDQLNDTNIGEQTTMTFNNNTRTVTRAAMALGHALDMADHYSQIANYMRLNKLIPPTALPRPAARPSGGG